mgnify:CR=1 FL=1
MLEKCVEQLINVVPVIIGFLMGFKAARPDEKLIKWKVNQGPTDEPDGDPFNDAMRVPDEEERVKTI